MSWPHLTNEEVIKELGLPSRDDMELTLRETGWGQWYNENAWVHPKTYPQGDHTYAALPLPIAYLFETEAWPPFERVPFIGGPDIKAPTHSIVWRLHDKHIKSQETH